jgi:hypothetical protein
MAREKARGPLSKIGIIGQEASAHPEGFKAAAETPRRRGWDSVFDCDPARADKRVRYFRWNSGALSNIAWNAVDRHVEQSWAVSRRWARLDERGGRRALSYA